MAEHDDRLRDALHETADAIDLPVIDWTSRLAVLRARRRRARRGAMATVLAVSALVAGVTVARGGEQHTVRSGTPGPAETDPLPVESHPNETTAPVASGTAISPALVWNELPPPPIPIRSGIATAWTGSEYLVIGLGDDSPESAAYDPATDGWRKIAAAPLSARADALAVWSGSKLIVWGGAPIAEGEVPLDDGAMYDPVADEWYPMASLPGGGRQASKTVSVWGGHELLVWGGGLDPNDGAAYDPTNNSWRPLPTAPVEWRDEPAGVWTGSELIVWGGSRTADGAFANVADGAAYSPSTDQWRALPPAPMQAAVVEAAWTGTQAVFTPGYSGDPSGTPFAHDTGGVYDPATDSWTPAGWLGQHPGTELLAINGQLLATAKGRSVLLDPTTGDATDIRGDELSAGVEPGTAVWTGSQILALMAQGRGLIGASIGSPSVSDTCTAPDAPPTTDIGWSVTELSLAPRTGAATAWTGREYIVWGGTDGTTVLADGVVVDPATGDTRTMSPAPIDARTDALAVWTGSEMLVIGGYADSVRTQSRGLWRAAAYDPSTDVWRELTTPPKVDGADASSAAAWTGEALLVLTDEIPADSKSTAGTYYTPGNDAAQVPLPPLPFDESIEPSSPPLSVWTGSEWLVTGRLGGRDVVAALRAPFVYTEGATWEIVATAPAVVASTAAVWTGDAFLFAGGGDPDDTTWSSASFDPATGEWRELAATPYHPGAELVWTGAEVMFAMKGGYGLVDPATGEITEQASPVWLQHGTGEGTGDGAVFLGQVNTDDCKTVFAVARYDP